MVLGVCVWNPFVIKKLLVIEMILWDFRTGHLVLLWNAINDELSQHLRHSFRHLKYLWSRSLCTRLWRQRGQLTRTSPWMQCRLAWSLQDLNHTPRIGKILPNPCTTTAERAYPWNRWRPFWIVLNMFVFKYVPDNKIEGMLHVIGEQGQTFQSVAWGTADFRDSSPAVLLGCPGLHFLWWDSASRPCTGNSLCRGYLRDASLEMEVNLEEKKKRGVWRSQFSTSWNWNQRKTYLDPVSPQFQVLRAGD